ncbi:MAG: hypothetical protein FJ299_08505 [Planctomycetes bacterium]|nr:hypothetical protein [Planctomycetota bacterium]
MPTALELPFVSAAIKLFLIALFAPLWWPILVEVRAEIMSSSAPVRKGDPAPPKPQGFVARLHGQAEPSTGSAAPRFTRRRQTETPRREGRAGARGFRAAR